MISVIRFYIKIFCFSILFNFAYSQTDTSYFPINQGYSWEYLSSYYQTPSNYDTTTFSFTQLINFEGKLFTGLSLNGDQPNTWLREENGKIYISNSVNGLPDTAKVKEFMIYDFNAQEDSTWEIPSGNYNYCNFGGSVTLKSRNDSIETPSGTYRNCITFTRYTGCRDAGIILETFAKGTGRVAYSEVTFSGGKNCKLNEFSLITSAKKNNFS